MTLWHVLALWVIGAVPAAILVCKRLRRVGAHYPQLSPLHCWFDFEDGGWLTDGTRIPGHTCLLEDGHNGPHEPTPDTEILVTFTDGSGTAVDGPAATP